MNRRDMTKGQKAAVLAQVNLSQNDTFRGGRGLKGGQSEFARARRKLL